MTDVVADLHVHTTRSDGEVDPDELAAVAADAGLVAVAITDHDRLPPRDAIRDNEDVAVIPGIELRVEAESAGRVDLLAYGVEATGALADRIDALQANRFDRAAAMVERLEDTLDVNLAIDIRPGIGRPHLAQAVANATDLSPQAVFDRYIGDDCPCYIPRDVPSFRAGRRLLGDAASAVVLAHPLRYDDPKAALGLVEHLDGLEQTYPYGADVDRHPLEQVDTEGLLLTGGSDAHTEAAIGACGLDRSGFEPIAEHLGVAMD